jgi:hypothetical protein
MQGQTAKVDTNPNDTGEDGDEQMKRRVLLAGLVGITASGFLPRSDQTTTPPSTGSLDSLLRAPARGAAPVSLTQLGTMVANAHRAFDACHYQALTDSLPGLIATVRASHDAAAPGMQRDQTSGFLARTYVLGSKLAVKQHEDAIGLAAADRALTAANASGDPLAIAASSRSIAIALRRRGCIDDATSVLTRAAIDLDIDHGDPPTDVLAAYGLLLCTAAYSLAQQGKVGPALELIGEAEEAAARIGLRQSSRFEMMFTSSDVAVYRIGIHHALGESGAALKYATAIDPRQLSNPERRARYHIDTARAWQQHGSAVRACQELLAIERHTPEEICRPSAKALISTMLYAPRPTPIELRPLAIRAGVIT